jgi:WD40 repeat protein
VSDTLFRKKDWQIPTHLVLEEVMFMNRITYVSILLFFAAVSGIFSQRLPPPPPPTPLEVLYPFDMIVSSDGKRIAVDYNLCTIVWDIGERKIIGKIPSRLSYFQKNTPLPIRAFNQDGSIRAEGNDRVLNLYNTENNRLIKKIVVFESEDVANPPIRIRYLIWPPFPDVPEAIENIYFTPDGQNIIVISGIGRGGRQDRIWSVDLMGRVSSVNFLASLSSYVNILALNIYQGRAVISGNSGITIVNLFSKRKEGEIPLNDNNLVLDSSSFSLNDNKNKNSVLLIKNGKTDENYLYVCDIEGRKFLKRMKIDSRTYLVRLTGEENIVALVALDNSICLYNYQTETEIARLVAYEDQLPLVPPPPPLGMSNRERTIQVGSFSSFADALRLMNDIKREGFYPYLERARQNNSTIWSVVINNVLEDEIPSIYGLLQSIGYTNILIRP